MLLCLSSSGRVTSLGGPADRPLSVGNDQLNLVTLQTTAVYFPVLYCMPTYASNVLLELLPQPLFNGQLNLVPLCTTVVCFTVLYVTVLYSYICFYCIAGAAGKTGSPLLMPPLISICSLTDVALQP